MVIDSIEKCKDNDIYIARVFHNQNDILFEQFIEDDNLFIPTYDVRIGFFYIKIPGKLIRELCDR